MFKKLAKDLNKGKWKLNLYEWGMDGILEFDIEDYVFNEEIFKIKLKDQESIEDADYPYISFFSDDSIEKMEENCYMVNSKTGNSLVIYKYEN